MKVSKSELAAIHKLLAEHQAHEDVQGYDPALFAEPRPLTVWHALGIGLVAALVLVWLAGLIGAVIDAG
jgi:hypothetical protein